MSQADKIEEQRKELLARGAYEIKDGEGGGFAQHDQEFANPALDQYMLEHPELSSEIADLERRIQDRKPASQYVEAAQSLHDDNVEQSKKFRFDRQSEVTDYVPGRLLHMREFMRLLLKLNPTFSYNEFSEVGRRGLNYVNDGKLTYITSIQEGYAIEWSQLRTDDHEVGTSEKYRGWRSVLMTMIEKGIVTEDKVHEVFGKPTGPRAPRWFRNLFLIRNQYCRDCESKLCVCKEQAERLRA